MVDLTTSYLGLALENPLVPSSSPLTGSLDNARRLEDSGAGAIIMPSLFEEEILAEQERLDRFLDGQAIGHGEADSFRPLPAHYRSREEAYLETLQSLKSSLSIPVLASLNGVTPGGWLDHAKDLEEAGADALELNVYYLAGDPDETSEQVEQRYVDIAAALNIHVNIPFAMKLSPQLTAPIALMERLRAAGADGVSLFNRFYQPDIDLESLDVVPRLALSEADEALLRIRWAALMFERVDCDIAVTGGFHTAADVLKALLAGADVVHLCSLLLREGPQALGDLRSQLLQLLEEREYDSVAQLKGSLSQRRSPDPAAYARANYLSVLQNYRSPAGVHS